ncbi:uncharacterized protein MEPE_01030 [Melanopsichium pennsylvanicum]|uniref:Uncharacterized protein n=2 Tax=Melanopsichium pennsylvanicum TaxID=63383 RepID=A0AAJ4XH68_9BASI|nr:putative protein [Melanopsichium pennsylvanicum 4]SNX82324.1 uncharacterized protein MEPE_01030 [Melanopsichium pennsylvanicum]
MAPSPSMTVAGVSALPLSSSAPLWHVMKRTGSSTSSTSNTSSSGYQILRISPKMNERGDFNGTCTKEEAMTITPETPDGSCTSYFADVTDYCCAAVGGVYNATFQVANVSEPQAMAFDHPICATSNYADMFSCYQYVTETHCSSTSPVPYGVCNMNGPDTSRAVQQAKSAAASIASSSARRWTLAVIGLSACTVLQLV